MPTKTTPRLLTCLVIAGALLAACSGGDDDGGDATTTTELDDATAVSSELEFHLLTLEDIQVTDPLQAKWKAGDVLEGVDIQLPDCVVEEPLDSASGSADVKFVTDTDLNLPSLEEHLARYEDGAGASDAFDAAAARLDGCADPEFLFQGAPSTGHIERLALDLPGEQTTAWRTTVTIAGANVSVTTIHILQGDLELSLVHTDLATPDAALLEGYAAKAVAQL